MVFVTPYRPFFPFIVGKYVWFRTTIDLALVFFLVGLLFSSNAALYEEQLKKLFHSPVVLAVTTFVFFFVLACFFGVDPSFSFWSNFERGEGGLQMIHLYLFFLLLISVFREEEDWQKILGWSLVAGALMCAYGYAAASGVKGLVGGTQFSDPGFRFQG